MVVPTNQRGSIFFQQLCKAAHGQCLLSSKWRLLGQWSLYFKLAYAQQTQDNLEFYLGYAGCFLQLSNVKPTQDCNAPEASHPVSVLQQVAAFAQVTKNKAYRQQITLKYTTTIISQPVIVLTGRNRVRSVENFWNRYKKIQKPPAMQASIYPHMSTIAQFIWWPSPFNTETRQDKILFLWKNT